MDKKIADKLITEYNKKLFGFALSKTSSVSNAEELASIITFEVYSSLLKRDNIENVNAYIYRVAQNVYAKYTDNAKRGAHLSLDEVILPAEHNFADELIRSETYKLLRREITYLSKLQREILIKHYYDKLKLNEISDNLGIPLGTVKWHLYEAKNSLKEGMNLMRTTGNLGLQPIRLYNMGHSGRPGQLGDTSDFLKKRLTQNITYSAYHKARTINEIAEELGVSPLFVEDEVEVLEEYGFMDKLPGGKYLTNIYITELTKEICEKEHVIYNKYAKIVCEKYIPLLIDAIQSYNKEKIYVPDNDSNLLLWTAVTYACGHKLYVDKGISSDEFSVKRKDGGDYIAFANVETDFEVSYDSSKYSACGDMNRDSVKYPISAWQLNTCYDGRDGGWRNNDYTDYEYLYEFINGTLIKDASQIEKYRRLYDKGYITCKDGTDKVNIIVVKNAQNNPSSCFDRMLPSITDELKVIGDEFDNELFDLRKGGYPAHMHKLCRAWTTNCLAHNGIRTRVLEQLLQSGVLSLPTESQKSGINTIMFSDILPE